ncbi:hypothetical protein OH76DRAFT_264227 [Lentinus brumalis]|uniref:Uncharacterized protein n=1 Tax=Lentinus brumalis TaxID=2498619 RepID=A0A371DGN0_9APHY|nr:hypothetical protein OH76DRAFT_264227 [Polyporus brumalis]
MRITDAGYVLYMWKHGEGSSVGGGDRAGAVAVSFALSYSVRLPECEVRDSSSCARRTAMSAWVAAARGASGALLNYNHALNACSSPPTARVSRQLTSYQVSFFQDLSRYPRRQRPIDNNVFSLRLHDASVIANQAYKGAQPDAETRESIVSDIDRAVRALVFRDRVTEALVRGGETEA